MTSLVAWVGADGQAGIAEHRKRQPYQLGDGRVRPLPLGPWQEDLWLYGRTADCRLRR